jgi:hypothetical protein
MTLEIALKRSLLSYFAQKSDDKTPPSGMKRIHWVGDREPPQAGQTQNQGGKRNENKPDRGAPGYRELSSIMLGEVTDAHKFFANQLLPSPYPAWLGTNYFCKMDLVRKRGRPPAIFGRVKTCYPSDGYIQNIQDMEIYFPQKDRTPDVVLIHGDDILHDPHQPVQSYCMRVKVLASEEDLADFNGYENLFLERGFLAEFEPGYIDLLDLREQDQAGPPWFYVIGSRWFASIPESVRVEVREQLGKLLHWNKLIFNYHPEILPGEIKTLNREFGFKLGFTEFVLIEPETPQQTVQIVAATFEKMFQRPFYSR